MENIHQAAVKLQKPQEYVQGCIRAVLSVTNFMIHFVVAQTRTEKFVETIDSQDLRAE